MEVVVNCISGCAYFCIGGCACSLFGAFCGYKCWDDVEKTPALVKKIPNSSENAVANHPISMSMPMPISMPTPRLLPEPNTDIGWAMTRLQDQPYPEMNSNCTYPQLMPNLPPNLPNLLNFKS